MKQLTFLFEDDGSVQIISNDTKRLQRWLDSGYCHSPERVKGGYRVTVSDNWNYHSTFRKKKI